MPTSERDGLARLIAQYLGGPPKRTQADLARASGLSRSYISRLRGGKREGLTPHAVGALSQAMGLDAQLILDAAGVGQDQPEMTFREFVSRDWRLNDRQRKGLLNMYYDVFGIKDGSTEEAQ